MADDYEYMDQDLDPESQMIEEQLVSTLLEDHEIRTNMLRTMLQAGLDKEVLAEIFQSFLRGFVHDENSAQYIVLDDVDRNHHICYFGWAKFKKMHVELIAKYSPLIEMGAGSGWLAFLLQHRGAKIVAYDSYHGKTFASTWNKLPWFKQVQEGSIEKLKESSFKSFSLLLCWPDVDSSFGIDCLKAYQGNTLVFIGEQKGGNTADNSFYDELSKNWTLVEELPLYSFIDIEDGVFIYKRK